MTKQTLTITVADIRKHNPCYDPTEVVGVTEDTALTLREWISLRGVKSPTDHIWLFSVLAPKRMAREFAVWCARRANRNRVPEVDAYIDSIEGYYLLGTHTVEQMRSAERATDCAADCAANWAAEVASQVRKARLMAKKGEQS